jgi:CheY-like chemotaxis protein
MAKILIVDDDLESVKLIGLMLERRGYTISAAQSGAQALEKVQSDDPDLVILDVMMPDMDGYEVCRRIRSNPATAGLPIIMFTAKTQVDDKVAGFQAGADDYLTKPVHPQELASRVEAVLLRSARKRAEGSPVVRARILGFLGSKGGVGTTTMAVNVAVALAQGAGAGKGVVLAEMRPGIAGASFQLRLRRVGGIARLLEQPLERINSNVVEGQLEEHSSGVFVLSGQTEPPGVAVAASPDHAEAIVQHLGAMADYLLLDLGVGLDPVNMRLLPLCEQVVVVIEPQRTSLVMAQTLLTMIADSIHLPRHRIRLVLVNKAPSAASFTKGTIEGLLQHDLLGVITPAPELAFQSGEQGVPMVTAQPDSLVAQQFRIFVDHLAGA